MKTRAQADKAGLPALDAEARNNPAGQFDVKLGEIYFGAADYPGAAAAISQAIGKGQISRPEDAFVYLGRAQVALKNDTDAKDAFERLKSLPNISPRVLRLWNLYSDMIPAEVSQPL
jgi:tetratricopeptide (TPR) repeat protein